MHYVRWLSFALALAFHLFQPISAFEMRFFGEEGWKSVGISNDYYVTKDVEVEERAETNFNGCDSDAIQISFQMALLS